MPQLRDAQTSELIAEGTPLELVVLADELGRDEVLFDDVGEDFDADALLQAHRENLDGLKTAANVERDPKAKVSLRAAHKAAEAELQPNRDAVKAATAELEAARERLEG